MTLRAVLEQEHPALIFLLDVTLHLVKRMLPSVLQRLLYVIQHGWHASQEFKESNDRPHTVPVGPIALLKVHHLVLSSNLVQSMLWLMLPEQRQIKQNFHAPCDR